MVCTKVANASHTGIEIWEESIFISEEIKATCDYFKIDPLIAVSEGTLIITAPGKHVSALLSSLKSEGINTYVIGEITKGKKVFIRKNGSKETLRPVKVDPFWNAYFSTLK
jgi:hydrogenase expression/formation protein HypE